ncbi:MAG: hypothetical protein J6V09_03270 [Clostridia bacterium]|nr:hypothetical protein [Clostridia bacterium]
MFKLKKIIGAASSVPEIRMWKSDCSSTAKAGCLFFAEDDSISNELVDNFPDKLKVIPISSPPNKDQTIFVAGFAVTKDMVFEADVQEHSGPITVGARVNVIYDDNGDLGVVTAEEEAHDAIVVDVSNMINKKADIIFL